mgnify:CR=1 FL=1
MAGYSFPEIHGCRCGQYSCRNSGYVCYVQCVSPELLDFFGIKLCCGKYTQLFLNKYFTFESKKKSLSQVLKFVLNISLCYLVAYGIAKPAVTWMLQGQQGALRDNLANGCRNGAFYAFELYRAKSVWY